jgi:hypothetical protein
MNHLVVNGTCTLCDKMIADESVPKCKDCDGFLCCDYLRVGDVYYCYLCFDKRLQESYLCHVCLKSNLFSNSENYCTECNFLVCGKCLVHPRRGGGSYCSLCFDKIARARSSDIATDLAFLSLQ